MKPGTIGMTTVDKQTFEAFIAEHKNLVSESINTGEPPAKIWVGNGGIMACVTFHYLGPNGEIDDSGKFYEYKIRNEN